MSLLAMNRSERRALLMATALVALGTAARLGLGPGEAAYSWEEPPEGVAAPDLEELRTAVSAGLERARVAARPLAAGERIDPNTAPSEELERLPGVGPATARAVVGHREEGGVFHRPEDLLEVRGIGPATLERMAPWLEFRAVPPRPAGRTAGGAALLNVNRATALELQELPGVGPALARRIVEHRQRVGVFREVEDLEAVPGIGPARLEDLRPLITVR